MSKFIVDEEKLSFLLQRKWELFQKEAGSRFKNANPDIKFETILTDEEALLYRELMEGKKSSEEVDPESFERIKKFVEEVKDFDTKMENDEFNTEIFTPEDIRGLFTFTDEDIEFIKKQKGDGKEKEEPVQES